MLFSYLCNLAQMPNVMKKLLSVFLLCVTLLAACGGRNSKPSGKDRPAAGIENDRTVTEQSGNNTSASRNTAPVKQYTYKVVETYPHATDSYTQGLFWHDGYLYEGTGQHGESRLMKIELETGKAVQEIPLNRRYFGEGITWHDGKIYQLTWQSGKAFVYDGSTFELLKTFSYKGEGWGITSDGEKLYMSDGTSRIFVRDPETFEVERVIDVTLGRNRRSLINELEWIDGEIWANIYMYKYNQVVRIDPESGHVTGIIDFNGIQSTKDFVANQTDVFNGIAYDENTGRIFVTGKNWNKLYQVEIVEKR